MAENILNYKEPMEYRRFGKTNEYLSVITLGGMRFIHGDDDPRDEIPEDTLEQCGEMVQLALKNGINHIETAQGYKKSEHVYGKVLNNELRINRSSYHLMTKGAPKTPDDTRKLVEDQLRALQTDYLDFYGWHGINNWKIFKTACATNGPVEELLKMKEEGIIKHVGFSTHAPIEVIIKAIETDYFEFVNLHYYYFFQRNYGAIALAESKDMGVFIISPNDKGGQLFNAPQKLKDITAPATPIQWNAHFCLANPAVHTLSFGMTHESHVEEMMGIFPSSIPLNETDSKILQNMNNQVFSDTYALYEGYDLLNDPSGLNIPEILRMRKMWKCYDMLEFGQYRYNLFEPDHHWFAGNFATPAHIAKINMSKVPPNIPLKEMIAECHQAFYKPKGKK